jgi:hypothetical protein
MVLEGCHDSVSGGSTAAPASLSLLCPLCEVIVRYLFFFAACLPVLGQVTSGSISWYLLDRGHEPIPQAVLTAADPATRGSFAMNANGGRDDSNNYLLDGVDDNDPNVEPVRVAASGRRGAGVQDRH